MECNICYENVTEDNIEFLECSHSLCQPCLSKLRNSLCPFCRAPIRNVQDVPPPCPPPTPVSNPIQVHVDLDVRTPIRSRRRRQRRERTTLSFASYSAPFLNLDEINEILSNLRDTTTSSVARSTSDTERQKRRSGRNRWQHDIAHNGTRNIVR